MNLSWGMLHAGLQSVLDTALDAVVVMGTEGEILGWNERATAAFGWSFDDVRGQQLSSFIIPHRYREAHHRGLRRFLETGEGPVLGRRIEIAALHRSGEEFPVELSITPSDQFGERLFIGFLRDISERKAVADRQQRLLQESAHRVKNMLTVVMSIAQQTARNASDLAAFERTFVGRLDALARAHQLLATGESETVSLSTLALQVLGHEVESGRASVDGPPVLLTATQVLGLSMILHELYTNAVKYGALCTDQGRIALRWSIRDREVLMSWSESGGTCDPDVPSSGFGRRMMEMSARADLKGSIAIEIPPEGLMATLRFPVGPEQLAES